MSDVCVWFVFWFARVFIDFCFCCLVVYSRLVGGPETYIISLIGKFVFASSFRCPWFAAPSVRFDCSTFFSARKCLTEVHD